MSSQAGLGRLRLVAPSHQAHVIMRQGGTGADERDSADEKERLPEGYRKGFDAGRLQGLAELGPRLRELEAENVHIAHELPNALSACLTELRSQAREEVVRLALLIAEAVLRAEPCRRDLLRSAVDEAMGLLGGAGGLRLRVSPADVALLQAPESTSLAPDIAVVPDPTLQPGDVVLETSERGLLVASLSTRLETLTARINERLTELRST